MSERICHPPKLLTDVCRQNFPDVNLYFCAEIDVPTHVESTGLRYVAVLGTRQKTVRLSYSYVDKFAEVANYTWWKDAVESVIA